MVDSPQVFVSSPFYSCVLSYLALTLSEAGGDLVLIQTSLDHAHVLMLTSLHLHMKSSKVCIETRSPPASLTIQDQVTKHTTVKWPIGWWPIYQLANDRKSIKSQ